MERFSKAELLRIIEVVSGQTVDPATTKADLEVIFQDLDISEREVNLARKAIQVQNCLPGTISTAPREENEDSATPNSTSPPTSSATSTFLPSSPQSSLSRDTPSRRIKLPPFSPQHSEIWFRQVSSLLQDVPDNEKRRSLLENIPTSFIRDCGIDPSSSFDIIFNAISRFVSKSSETAFQEALRQRELGDRKPSVALRQLQSPLPTNLELVKYKFLDILPPQVRVALKVADVPGKTILDLAETADAIMDSLEGPNSLEKCNIMKDDSVPLERIGGRVVPSFSDYEERLTHPVTTLGTNAMSRTNKATQRFRTPAISTVPEHRFCWYHINFGRQARKCEPNCTFNVVFPMKQGNDAM